MSFFANKSSFFVCLIIVWSLSAVSAAAQTAGAGRPDPTGQGRYTQFGTERVYEGAKVLKTLPAGAPECASAGELIGVEVWNSTREGRAILSKLSEQATVSVVDGRIFLCRCAAGYNELFLVKSEQSSAPVVAPKPEEKETKVEKPAPTSEPMAGSVTPAKVSPQTAATSDPCFNPQAMVAQLQEKGNGRKKDATISCGGLKVTWSEYKHSGLTEDQIAVLLSMANNGGGGVNRNSGYSTGGVTGGYSSGYGSPVYGREGRNYVGNSGVTVRDNPNSVVYRPGSNYVGTVPTQTTSTPAGRAPQNIVGTTNVPVASTGNSGTGGTNFIFRTGGGGGN